MKAENELLFPDAEFAPKLAHAERIFAVTSGKGGVGKSFLTANLGFYFARAGKNTTLIDADLGGPNLHTCLGLRGTRRNLSDFLKNRVGSLDEVAVETGCPNLYLISGTRDTLTAPNLTYFEKQKLISNICRLKTDYAFMDLSAGTSYNTLDLFLASTHGVLVTLPEPSAVENLYRFLRAVIHRKLSAISKEKEIVAILNEAEDLKNPQGIRIPVDIIERVSQLSPDAGKRMLAALRRISFSLIMNQTRREEDIRAGETIAQVASKHLGLKMEFAGYVDYDFTVWQSVTSGKLLLQDYPRSAAAACIERIGAKLLGE